MISAERSEVEAELACRRDCLREASAAGQPEVEVNALLGEVEEALDRAASDVWGLCTVCHGAIEPERLRTDPLVRVCLECMGEEDRRALQHDLESAALVQASLLPPPTLRRNGWEIGYHWEPLGAVSGDHVDLLLPEHPDAPLYVLLADIAGKGVAASLLQTHLSALFRALALANLELPDLLAEVNRLFFQATPANAYATLVAVKLEENGEIEMVNAGHPAALHARQDGVVEAPGSGLPLGLFREVSYRSSRLRLAPGEALMLYTDGLTESENEGEEYGRQRAAAALDRVRGVPVSELLRQCRGDLTAFLGQCARVDDLTLVAIRRTL